MGRELLENSYDYPLPGREGVRGRGENLSDQVMNSPTTNNPMSGIGP